MNDNVTYKTLFVSSEKSNYPYGRFVLMSRIVNTLDKSGLFWASVGVLTAAYFSIVELNAGILLMVVAGVSIGFIISRLSGRAKAGNDAEFRIYIAVFSISIFVACMAYNYNMTTNGTPYRFGLEDDDYSFDSKALDIYKQINVVDKNTLHDELRLMGTGTRHISDSYTISIAWLYRILDVFGCPPHPLFPRILNAVALAWIAVLVFGVSMWCNIPKNIARFTSYFCGLFPYMLFNSLHTYRDTIISLGIVAMIVGLTCMLIPPPSFISRTHTFRSRLRFFFLFIFGCTLLINLRQSYQWMIVLFIVTGIVVSQKRLSLLIIYVILSSFLGVTLFFTGSIAQNAIINSSHSWALEYYHMRHVNSQGNITSAIFSMPYNMSIPFRMLLRNVSPLPLPQSNIFDNIERIGTVVWLLMLPTLLRGIGYSFSPKKWEHTRSVRIVASSFILFFLLNIMTTLQDRHITTYLPAACVIAAHYIAFGKNKVLSDFKFTVMGGICIVTIYQGWRIFI